MIRFLLKIAFVAVLAILGYNYFFGDSEEKAQSKKVFHEVGDVARSVGSLIRSEREKFNHGKYDGALDKLGNAYQKLRDQAKYLDENVIKRLDAAEKRRAELKKELDGLGDQPAEQPSKSLSKKEKADQEARAAELKARQEELTKQLESLQKEFENIASEAERKN